MATYLSLNAFPDAIAAALSPTFNVVWMIWPETHSGCFMATL